MNNNLYLFLDESGNFDFSSNGTKYLVFTCLTTKDPDYCILDLYKLKHDLIRQCHEMEEFHASEDKQVVRNRVFGIINKCKNFTIDSIIAEKRKANPSIRDMLIFYPKTYNHLLGFVLERYKSDTLNQITIFTDAIPHEKKRKAIEKALKTNLEKHVPSSFKGRYKILHHESKSHLYWQVVDYCCWAIYIKWSRNGKELRPYKVIEDKIESEFDIFRRGKTTYYK